MTIDLTTFTTDMHGDSVGVSFAVTAPTASDRLAVVTFISQCAAYAIETLQAGRPLEAPGASTTVVAHPVALDPAILKAFAEDLLADRSASAPVAAAPVPPPASAKRKRRTRAELDAAAAAAAAAAVVCTEDAAADTAPPAPPLPFEDKVVAVTTAQVKVPEPEPEPEPAPITPAAKSRSTVATSTIKVRDESFTVIWTQTGGHVSGKVIIADVQAERIGGQPEVIIETSENRSAVKSLLEERLDEYFDAAAYAKQAATAEPVSAPPVAVPAAKPAKATATKPVGKVKSEVLAADDIALDPTIQWLSVDLLKHVSESRKADGPDRATALRLWTTHLYNTREVNGIADAEACAAWVLTHQQLVHWFKDNPLKDNARRNVAATWQVLAEGEATAKAAAGVRAKAVTGDDIFDVDEDDIGYGEG